MANGIIIVDKPADWTSQDVAAKLRGVFHERRIGHGGTLDPMATGVLPIFVGRATRAVPYFESAEKEYIATLHLGLETDTQDITGTCLRTAPVAVTQAELEHVLSQFLGPQQQLPPMYSAVKIGGKKLYELARQGKTVERAPRQIEIFALELLGGQGADWRLRVYCSKGTYIRTLCQDIGAALGCGGCMAALRRTKAGAFSLDQAIPLADLIADPDAASRLLGVDTLFAQYPAVTLTARQEQLCRNGAAFTMRGLPAGFVRVYSQSGAFLMLGRECDGRLATEKSFFEVSTT